MPSCIELTSIDSSINIRVRRVARHRRRTGIPVMYPSICNTAAAAY